MRLSANEETQFGSWFRSIFLEDKDLAEPPALAVMPKFIKRLFDGFEQLTSDIPADTVAKGLDRLIDQGRSDEMHTLMDDRLPLEERIAAVASLSGLLRYFEAHCLPTPSHDSSHPRTPLNEVCYLWWDRFPAFPMPGTPERKAVEAAFLRHFSEALDSDSPAVQEYGLHGFSHWSHDYPKETAIAVDAFLKQHPNLGDSLRAYAASAREGLAP